MWLVGWIQSSSQNGTFESAESSETMILPSNSLTNQGVCAEAEIHYAPGTTDSYLLNHFKPYYEIYEIDQVNGTSSIILTGYFSANQVTDLSSFTMQVGFQYTVKLYSQLNGSTLNGILRFHLPYYSVKRNYVGGLRLSTKEIFESATGVPIITHYEYQGGVVKRPHYETHTENNVFKEIYATSTVGCQMNGTPCLMYNGNELTYAEFISPTLTLSATYRCPDPEMEYHTIRTNYGLSNENGYMVTLYEMVDLNIPDESKPFWLSGLVDEESVYRADNILLSKVVNEYTSESSSQERFSGLTVGSISISQCLQEPIGTNDWANYFPSIRVNSPIWHELSSIWFYHSAVENYSYDQNGGNPLYSRTEYHHDNITHKQLTRVISNLSNGDKSIAYLKYPKDFNTAGASDNYSIAVKSLVEKHCDAIPIYSINSIVKPDGSEFIVSGDLTLFNLFSGNPKPLKKFTFDINSPMATTSGLINGLCTINSSGVFNFSSQFSEKVNYSNYNGKYKLLNLNKANDINESIEWNQSLNKPTAIFKNALYSEDIIGNECSFTSFEDSESNNDNWGVSPYNSEYHCGTTCYSVPPHSYGPTKDFKPENQNQKFRFSCWVKTPNGLGNNLGQLEMYTKHDSNTDQSNYPIVQGSSISINFSNTGNEWKYIEGVIDLGAVRQAASTPANNALRIRCFVHNDDPNNIILIDDIRFSPYISFVKSFTYDNDFYLPNSISNERSLPQYFFYDANQRLQRTEDQDRNVLAINDYHYLDFNNANDHNYIASTSLLNAKKYNDVLAGLNSSDYLKTIQYCDGLGRSNQTVQAASTPDGKDLVAINVYDAFGREGTKYLLFKEGASDGSFYTDALTDQASYYSNSQNLYNGIPVSNTPFSAAVFEPSPFNRIIEQGTEGDEWQPGTYRTTRNEYWNNSSANSDDVLLWEVSYEPTTGFSNGANCLSEMGDFYPDNSLLKTITTDEGENITITFKDMSGKLILERKMVHGIQNGDDVNTFDELGSNGNGVSNSGYYQFDTYYVYNDLGELTYVIPPKASRILFASRAFSETDQVFSNYIYGYHYDSKGRLVEKKIPGQDYFNSYVYDNRDKQILAQTPQQKNESKWTYYKYDVLGREIEQGVISSTSNRTILENQASASIAPLWEGRISGTNLFSDNALPQASNFNVENVDIYNLYDDYDFDNHGQSFEPFHNTNEFSQNVFGLPISSKVRVLGTSNYLQNINFYDSKARLIQEKKMTLLSWDRLSYEYDFTNKLVLNLHYQPTENIELNIQTRNEYDHSGRLRAVYKKVNNDQEIQLSAETYNDLGQLTQKALHNDLTVGTDFMQYIDYRYNIKGWLTSINNASLESDPQINPDEYDAFGEELFYQDISGVQTDESLIKASEQYNGNISAIKWKIRSPEIDAIKSNENLYVFRYDDLSRLTAGYYAHDDITQPEYFNQEINKFQESQTYDMMGNIAHLIRYDSNGEVDNLDYSYDGNKLLSVTDNSLIHFSNDFGDGVNTGNDYEYNSNGSMIEDKNKTLLIEYNQLELPSQVNYNGVVVSGTPSALEFVYDALGNKLKKSYDGKDHYYVNGIEYESTSLGPQLLFINTEEGRIRQRNDNTLTPELPRQFIYDYFLKDHLGSIRAVLTEENSKTEYYATMENQNGAAERLLFNNVDSTRENKPADEPTDASYSPDYKVSKLNAADGKTIGVAKSLSVTQGDQVSIETKYFFNDYQFNNYNVSINDLLSSLASTFIFNSPSMIGYSEDEKLNWASKSFTSNSDVTSFLNNAFGNNTINDPAKPQAFLVYLFYNKDYKFNPEASGVLQVEDPNSLGSLAVLNIKMPETGYFYVYTNNESDKTVNFNNTGIIHLTGSLLEENHYYPYGKVIDELSSKKGVSNGKINCYKYNGKELQNELNWGAVSYGARMYDPVRAKWYSIDQQAESYFSTSPYVYVGNNPIRQIDPDGNNGWDVILGIAAAFVDDATGGVLPVRDYASQYVNDEKDYNNGLTTGDAAAVAIGGGEISAGTDMIAGGTAVVAVGVTAELPSAGSSTAVVAAGGAAVGTGTLLAAHGSVMMATATKNLATGKGKLPEDKKNESTTSKKPDHQTSSGQATDQHGNKLGPSGKPQLNTVEHSSRKAAKDAARNEGKGAPVNHTSPKKGNQHYQATDGKGQKIPNSTHHEYP
ncbi:MAG: DUF6443 domain-containing protein [Bacteroidia bacterium]